MRASRSKSVPLISYHLERDWFDAAVDAALSTVRACALHLREHAGSGLVVHTRWPKPGPLTADGLCRHNANNCRDRPGGHMDPLSEVLSLLRPHSYTVSGVDHGGAFSVRFPQYQGVKCYAIVSGEQWVEVEGEPAPVHVCAGDCFLLPRGRPFRLANDLSIPSVDALLFQWDRTKNGEIRTIGGGGACFTVGGHFLLEGAHAHILFGLLPPVVHLRSEADRAAIRWSLERL